MKRLAFVFAFLLLLAGQGSAQLPTCTVSGVAYTANGSVRSGVIIRVVKVEQAGSLIGGTTETTTAVDGTWSLTVPRSSTAYFCSPEESVSGITSNCNNATKKTIPNAATASYSALVTQVNSPTMGIVLKDEGTSLADLISTIDFVGSGVTVTKTATGTARVSISGGGGGGGSLTVAEADSSPSVDSVDTLSVDQTKGLIVTNPASGEARIGLSGVPYSALSLTGAILDADLASGINATKIGGGAVSNTEFGYLDGVTSAIQTQLGLKANLISPTFTGVPAAPTAANGTNTTQIATTAFVQDAIGGISSGVVSFNTRTGAVLPATNDYTWAQVDKTTSSLADITTRSASDLSSGTLPLARLSNIANAQISASAAIAYSKLSLTGAILNADLAGSIAASKLVGTDIDTLGTVTTGTWNSTAIGSQYGGTGQNFSAATGFTFVTSGTFSAVAGTGSGNVVRATAPAIAGGTHTGITGLGIRSSGTGAFDLNIVNTEDLTAARNLTVKLNDSARTVDLGGNLTVSSAATISGTNTGDQTSVTGNAGTATALQTARNINGVAFDGTANITVTAAAGTLSGSTLASGVTASSLTSFGSTPTIVTPSFTTGFTIGGTAATGTIPRGNGTNFVASAFTMAAPGTSGNVLTSDGTNWLSSAPAGGGGGLTIGTSTITSGTTKRLLFDLAGVVSETAGIEYQSGASPNAIITAQNAAHTALVINSAASPSAAFLKIQNNGTDKFQFLTTNFLQVPHLGGVRVDNGETLNLHEGTGPTALITIGNNTVNIGTGGTSRLMVDNRGTARVTAATVTEAGYPSLTVTGTWNASGVTHDGIKLNVTNTASAADSKLLDLQVGGTSQFKVNKDGSVQLKSVTFSALPTVANGLLIYCSDCTLASPCASGGSGALAKGINSAWVCN